MDWIIVCDYEPQLPPVNRPGNDHADFRSDSRVRLYHPVATTGKKRYTHVTWQYQCKYWRDELLERAASSIVLKFRFFVVSKRFCWAPSLNWPPVCTHLIVLTVIDRPYIMKKPGINCLDTVCTSDCEIDMLKRIKQSTFKRKLKLTCYILA